MEQKKQKKQGGRRPGSGRKPNDKQNKTYRISPENIAYLDGLKDKSGAVDLAISALRKMGWKPGDSGEAILLTEPPAGKISPPKPIVDLLSAFYDLTQEAANNEIYLLRLDLESANRILSSVIDLYGEIDLSKAKIRK